MRSVILALMMVAGCAGPGGGARLGGIEWRASDINGIPVEGGPLTLTLGEGGRASGQAGCNSWFGNYRFGSDQGISFSAIGSTRKLCAPAVMDQERRFLSVLESASGYSSYRDDSVSLVAADGRAIRFTRSRR